MYLEAGFARDCLLKRGRDVRYPMSRRRGRPRSHVSARDPMSATEVSFIDLITHLPMAARIGRSTLRPYGAFISGANLDFGGFAGRL